MEPTVSVIIITHERAAELRAAIESAKAQNYDSLEIIVVDDNESGLWNKRVEDIVEQAGEGSRFPVSLISEHRNNGSARARNIGINAASGEYICFLDDDDIYLPDRIANQVSTMIETDADYSLTDLALYNEQGELQQMRRRRYLLKAEGRNLMTCHLKYHMTGTDTLMFRRDYINAIGGFDPIDQGDEFFLMVKAIKAGGRLAYVPTSDVRAVVHYRTAGQSNGEEKVRGENYLFDFKKQHFKQLSAGDVRYIKMRHHAVQAFAYIRMHKYGRFVAEGVASVACDPIQCAKMLIEMKGHR